MCPWLVRIWAYKNADEKEHTVSRRRNVQNRTKNGYCVNPPLPSLMRLQIINSNANLFDVSHFKAKRDKLVMREPSRINSFFSKYNL